MKPFAGSRMSRPSPALVAAAVALCFAMVGTAVAGPDAISSKITKSKVKKISKKQATKVINSTAAGGALEGTYPDPEFAQEIVPLELNTGWAPEVGTAPQPAVWKDAYGVVHFIGSLQRTSGTGTQPFALPEQFRPATDKFPGLTVEDGLGFLEIKPDGSVTAFGLTPATADPAGFLGIEDVEFQAGT